MNCPVTSEGSALQCLMFLKQKRSGQIKGRGCADGQKQREHLGKEDTTSPTVTTEGLLLSCMIDANERRASLLPTSQEPLCKRI